MQWVDNSSLVTPILRFALNVTFSEVFNICLRKMSIGIFFWAQTKIKPKRNFLFIIFCDSNTFLVIWICDPSQSWAPHNRRLKHHSRTVFQESISAPIRHYCRTRSYRLAGSQFKCFCSDSNLWSIKILSNKTSRFLIFYRKQDRLLSGIYVYARSIFGNSFWL